MKYKKKYQIYLRKWKLIKSVLKVQHKFSTFSFVSLNYFKNILRWYLGFIKILFYIENVPDMKTRIDKKIIFNKTLNKQYEFLMQEILMILHHCLFYKCEIDCF